MNNNEKELNYRRGMRRYEAEFIQNLLEKYTDVRHKSIRMLEIGGGAGWQAEFFRKQGYNVVSVDVPSGNYREAKTFDIIEYDGHILPFHDNAFDIIFSSNVLEHIPHVEDFQKEVKRVLKDDGTVIHVIPSVSWRILSFLTFYPYFIKKILLLIIGKRIRDGGTSACQPYILDKVPAKKTLWDRFFRYIIPLRHGVRGNALQELYLFSAGRWRKLFIEAGWEIKKIIPLPLCYSGYKLFGPLIKVGLRRNLSAVFGGAANIFIIVNSQLNEKKSR